jgi:hypothetical protein
LNSDLVLAIREKRLIEFVYKAGRIRIVEPHDYGIRGGVESLLGYQIRGESRSGAPHGWKQFDVDHMADVRYSSSGFPAHAPIVRNAIGPGMCFSHA